MVSVGKSAPVLDDLQMRLSIAQRLLQMIIDLVRPTKIFTAVNHLLHQADTPLQRAVASSDAHATAHLKCCRGSRFHVNAADTKGRASSQDGRSCNCIMIYFGGHMLWMIMWTLTCWSSSFSECMKGKINHSWCIVGKAAALPPVCNKC